MLNELSVLTKERGVVRFGDVMNHAQIALIEETERQIRATGKVRIIVLKARQLGLSTVIEGIIFILSMMFSDYQSLILSHDKESSEHLLTMTNRFWMTYPFKRFHTEKYAGRKQLAWSDTQSNITIATANNETAGSSKTIHALHASEVAKWRGDAAQLIASLNPAIPFFGLTCIFYESTAKGIGNYFHSQVQLARSGDSDLKLLFFPWHQHPEYTASYLASEDIGKYSELGVLSDEEKELMRIGVTKDRLIWRRYTIINTCNNDLSLFHQEYPSTIDEAFLSSGRNVFHLDNLAKHYLPMKPVVGRLDNSTGKVVFIEDEYGPLKIYKYPSQDTNHGVYQMGVDPTHSRIGDFAVAQVINRRTLEQCAVLRTKVDPTTLGELCMMLGEYYNYATIAVEKQGPGYATIGFLAAKTYPRLWASQKIDRAPGLHVSDDVYGWSSNTSSKPMALSRVVNALGQHLQYANGIPYGLVIHDQTTFEEMRDYIINDAGGYQNGNGSQFDDTVMAYCIAYATHTIDPPVLAWEPDAGSRERAREVVRQLPPESPLSAKSVDGKPSKVGVGGVVRDAGEGKVGILLSQSDYDRFGDDESGGN